jgi:hypothetical protein
MFVQLMLDGDNRVNKGMHLKLESVYGYLSTGSLGSVAVILAQIAWAAANGQ